MRFLIAGLGSVGRRHLRNLVALGERDIVLLRSGKSTLPDDELDGFPTVTTLEAALDRQPAAVIVSNPTALHLDVAIPAAGAGCHLLLEKPVSHTLERTRELLEALDAGRGRALIGYQYRFHPGLKAVHRWLLDGAIGRVVAATSAYGDYLPAWHPWEDYRQGYSALHSLGGGVILTLSHPVDSLEWLLGPADLAGAWSAAVPELEIEAEAAAAILLAYPDDKVGLVRLDFLSRPRVHRLELIGTTGAIQWDEADGSARLHRRDGEEETLLPPAGFDRNDMFLAELAHFLEVARGEEQPVCSVEDGVRTLGLLVAAKEFAARAKIGRSKTPASGRGRA